MGDNSLPEIAEGVTNAILNFTREQIVSLANRFRNRDVAFIGNSDTIQIVKEQLKTGEWDLSKKYVEDKELRILIQMGLTLRKLEFRKQFDKLHNLREKIVLRFQTRGLHIAQFVQRGIFAALIGDIAPKINSIAELKSVVKETLENVEKNVIFIKETDDINRKFDEVKTSLYANKPATYIIFGKNLAVNPSNEIVRLLRENIAGYAISLYKSDKGDCIYFVNKKWEGE